MSNDVIILVQNLVVNLELQDSLLLLNFLLHKDPRNLLLLLRIRLLLVNVKLVLSLFYKMDQQVILIIMEE